MPDARNMLAVYGTLKNLSVRRRLGVADAMEFVCDCQIRGTLVDLGAYPGLIAGDGIVHGQLYRVTNPKAWIPLDSLEGIVAGDDAASLYLRKQVQLIEPPQECWVYVYNQDVSGRAVISSGVWRGPGQNA